MFLGYYVSSLQSKCSEVKVCVLMKIVTGVGKCYEK